jgi:hypothetical protein
MKRSSAHQIAAPTGARRVAAVVALVSGKTARTSLAAKKGLPCVSVPAGTRNHFALDRGVGSRTTPRLDGGLLGIAVLDAPDAEGGVLLKRPWREWSSTDFRIGRGTRGGRPPFSRKVR